MEYSESLQIEEGGAPMGLVYNSTTVLFYCLHLPDIDAIVSNADSDGLPRTATWSIKSLLPPSSPPSVLTPSDLTHLLRLARLRPPATTHETTALVKDVNDLAHFTRHIQSVDVESVAPLRGVWGDEVGMAMREDVVEEGEYHDVR
ncbi:hypothetical protein BC937DRAFT_93341 [Endogone sp. FLAS-F59071]|nr:hypothetical protein BC937DRAFT_93341 [Endogone sp. FLAS-F59071]|eukprot:RUS21212.1 hypothetical protein BC937DRAFT_93341 [Endogone sp. FLAS-F59071]